MGPRSANHKGIKFGLLTGLEFLRTDRKDRAFWKWKCECGNTVDRFADDVIKRNRLGYIGSCGCNIGKVMKGRPNLKRRTHGLCSNPYDYRIHSIWLGMLYRCNKPERREYKDYGGRGIKVCKEWHKAVNFSQWAKANGYKEDLCLDRINNDGNYEPSNCRWTTRMANQNNRRNSVFLEFNGETKTLSQWCRIYGLNTSAVSKRNKKGYSAERVLGLA